MANIVTLGPGSTWRLYINNSGIHTLSGSSATIDLTPYEGTVGDGGTIEVRNLGSPPGTNVRAAGSFVGGYWIDGGVGDWSGVEGGGLGGGADVPDAIDDLAAEAGIEEIVFTWSEPDDGGAEIIKYTLYRDGVEYADEVESPYTADELDGDVLSGPWTVTATNSEGESEPSNEVSATPTAARSDDEMNLTAAEWASYAQDYDRMQLDGGSGKIHLPCYDQDFIASIEAVLPPEILSRVVFGSRGGRGCVG